MSPYKSFIAAAKNYFQSVAFLKFLLAASIFIFAAGGLFYLLGLFILGVSEAFICLGSILIWAGLLLSIFKEDVLTIAITSGVISLGSLVAWIIKLAGGASYFGITVGGSFAFTPFFFFLIFGAISIVVFIMAEKFKSMRAASAAARPQGVPCPRCGSIVPFGSGFCPACGTPAPQYAPPQPPPYAPPQMQYAPPQAPPQYAPPAPPAAPAEPVSQPAPATKKCVSCGADLPVDAMFCGKCGSKQG